MRLAYDRMLARRVSDPEEFGRVAVLLGGDSSEREISLLSGGAVLAALRRRGVAAAAFDPRERSLLELLERFDRVWIALHGPGGEDGTVQGALEYLGIPYTGSGVAGSAIGMDKLRTKRLAQAIGVASPDAMELRGPQDFELALERLRLPLIVKPATQGSSVGMTKVVSAEALPAAYAAAVAVDRSVFAEPWITGREYTVALLQGVGAALDPHRDAARLLRLPGEVFPRRHALFLSLWPVAAGRAAPAEPRPRGVRGRRRRRLGARRLHDGCRRRARCCSRSTPFPA